MWRAFVQNLKSTFDSDGYAAIQSFLDNDEVDELRQETLRFIAEEVPGLPVDVVYCENRPRHIKMATIS